MMKRFRVVLIQMPFAVTSWPALGVSLLKSILVAEGHDAKVLYFNYDFSKMVDKELYDKVARGAPQNIDLAGEWVFSATLWGDDASSDAAYFREILLGRHTAHKKMMDEQALEDMRSKLSDLSARARGFIEYCCKAVDWSAVDVVGFTSTFQQHVASLALAKELKKLHPHLTILFGGANCEGRMGWATLRNFPFVDAVCLGEGDAALPEFLRGLGEGAPKAQGFITRDDLRGVDASSLSDAPRPAVDLESLPFPDFDDFFKDAIPDSDEYRREHRLIFESSRGCWWGQKNHCTFCGLNGSTMAFRQKSGQRAVQELEHLVEKYGKYTRHVTATDSIMPYNYFASFLPRLAELKLEISLFYETKANLKKQQIEAYRLAGLTAIQPGIESLSTDVLRLMRKGVSALQNVQLLKWCHEYGIAPNWNYLAGFPGERAEWYAPLPALVRKLKHLAPPIGVSTLRFDRFSPYTEHPEDFSITQLAPYPSYAHVYRGIESKELTDIAYYFVCHFDGEDNIDNYVGDVFEELNDWKSNAEKYALFHLPCGDCTLVFDARGACAKIFRLTGLVDRIFERCDGVVALDSLRDLSTDRTDAGDVVELLEGLGIFVRDGNQILNVSVPLDREYKPPPGAVEKISALFADECVEGGEAGPLVIPQKNVAIVSEESILDHFEHKELVS